MRKFSKGQKRVLKDYVKSGFFDNDLLINKYGNKIILLKQLEKINDYETINQDLDRLINDLLFKDTEEEKIQLIDKFI